MEITAMPRTCTWKEYADEIIRQFQEMMVTDRGYSLYLWQGSGIVTLPAQTTHISCSSHSQNCIFSDSPFPEKWTTWAPVDLEVMSRAPKASANKMQSLYEGKMHLE